jgi:hypothetical protein
MLFGQIERELVDGEPAFSWPQAKLPHHLQRLVDQAERQRDIWEWEQQHPDDFQKYFKLKVRSLKQNREI